MGVSAQRLGGSLYGAAKIAVRLSYMVACIAALVVWGANFSLPLATVLLALVAVQLGLLLRRFAWRSRLYRGLALFGLAGLICGAVVLAVLGLFVALALTQGVRAADHWVLTYSGMLPILLAGLYPCFLLAGQALLVSLAPLPLRAGLEAAAIVDHPLRELVRYVRMLARGIRTHPVWAAYTTMGGYAGSLALFFSISHSSPLHHAPRIMALALGGIVGTLLVLVAAQRLAAWRTGVHGRAATGYMPPWMGVAIAGYAAGELLGIATLLLLALGAGVGLVFKG
jgi:hypothetical protein